MVARQWRVAFVALCGVMLGMAPCADAQSLRALTFVDTGDDSMDGGDYGSGTSYGNAEISTSDTVDANFEAEMLLLINVERSKAGLPALCINNKLHTAAQVHSNDMAQFNYMDHTGHDGSNPSKRARRAGYGGGCGENVAAGQQTVEDVVKSWMNSPGHRANILGKYTHFGAGYSFKQGTTYKHYWTQKFGSAASESCSSGPAPGPAPYGPAPTPDSYGPAPTSAPVPEPEPVPDAYSTPAPVTESPATPVPTTGVPETPCPTSKTPATGSPATASPETPCPPSSTPEVSKTPCPTSASPAPAPTPAKTETEARAQC